MGMFAGKGKALAALGVLALLLAALVVVLVQFGESDAPDGGGGAGSVAAQVEGDAGDAASLLRLSSWDRFGEFWEECGEGEAAYSEGGSDGAARCYRLRDGFEPGPGVDERSHAALLGAERVGLSSEGAARWDLAAVDCSTGEVSWWAMSSEVAARLSDPEADLDVLREQGVVPLDEGRWVVYADEPQEVDGDKAGGDGIEDAMQWYNYSSKESAMLWHDYLPDEDKGYILSVLPDESREDLRQAIIDLYGEEELEKYE